jgi:hypothetical protein
MQTRSNLKQDKFVRAAPQPLNICEKNQCAQTQRVREKRLFITSKSAQNPPSNQIQPRDTERVEPQPKLTRSGGRRLST